MREVLRGYLLAALEDVREAGTEATLARELWVFSDAMRTHDNLRQILTDPGISSLERRNVAADLLAGRGLEATASLVAFTFRAERPSALPAVLGQLIEAVAAGDRSADGDRADASIATSGSRQLLRGYSERVFQDQPGTAEIDEIEDELFRFARVLDGARELARALADATAPVAGRLGVLDDLLEAKVSPPTLRLARFVVRAGRLRDIVGTFDLLVSFAAAERGRRVAEVRSAIDLDDVERSRLAVALGRLVERTVEVRVVIDPSVVGGMLVTVGDLVIDGTIRLRLERLRDALAGSS